MEFKQLHQPGGKDCRFQCLAKSSQMCLLRSSRSHFPKYPTLPGAEGNGLPDVLTGIASRCSVWESENNGKGSSPNHCTSLVFFTANKLPKLHQPHESSSSITATLVTGRHNIKKRESCEEAGR